VLAYVLLAHEGAEQISELVQTLLDADPTARVVVHYDLNSSQKDFAALEQAFQGLERAWLVKDRVRCGWGLFGLVDGVTRALRVLRDQKVVCDYVYLLSGSCMPSKPLAKLKRFLAENRGMEFIEAHPPEWMVDGLREERYQYRHWFSYRTHRTLFESSWRIQRALRLKLKLPRKLVARFGPQWWCLTSETCFAILNFIDRYPGAYRFFKTTWIPDELFFQTLASSIATPARVFGKSLTFFKFTWKGRPLTFYDDHVDLVPELPCFFVRKVGPSARLLRQRLAEIAAAPDDGEDFPSLDNKEFDYEKRVREQTRNPVPGQLYYGGQTFNGWPSSLANVRKPFVVLHGPPAVTRIVMAHLRGAPGLTLLGRVFHPTKVELEPLGPAFGAFGPDDAKIRDMDPPLYLSRLLERADGLPVIEISPGDIPAGEGHFLYNNNVIFISCQPNDPTDQGNRRLYWTLAAAANPASAKDELRLEWPEGSTLQDVPRFVDALVDKYSPWEHRKWLTEALLEHRQERPFLRLQWGDGKRIAAGEPAARRLTNLLQDTHGAVIRPLARAFSGIDARLAGIRPLEITGELPSQWRAYFSSGMGRNFESWAAAFDRSNLSYAVVHGPPALTGLVAEHLKRTRGLAVLGRVFEPRNPLADDGDAARDLTEEGLLVRETDRPLYLRRLLSAAEGFPVIEICPGDEPAGEGFVISNPNAVFVTCQPNLLEDDVNLCLYWALAAVANPMAAEDNLLEPASGGNPLRARESIDAFIEKYTPRGHREWLNKTVLDDAWFHARAPNEQRDDFVRLFWGAARNMDGDREAEAMVPLRQTKAPLRVLGQTGGPLVEALADLQRRLADQRLDAATGALPEQWRLYFSLSKPDAAPTVEWAAALRRSTIGFAVLHGPPRMTRIVREHLEQSPDVALLGRIFDPAGSAELTTEDQQLLAQDRSRYFTALLARSNGFPVVEMSPGDDPVGETSLLQDENAVFISCQPDHADPAERTRLYWALTAAADPASADTLEGGDRAHASLLRVRNEIDAFIESFTSREHRAAIDEALLGETTPDAVLRLSSGTADRVARGEPLSASLTRLRRKLGPAFTPLIRGLTDIEAKFAALRTHDLVEPFPTEWRDYFSTRDEPSFESWQAALGPSTARYWVLYGPPAATQVVRSHLAAQPSLRMLGRVFDPDAAARAAAAPQAAMKSSSRVEDRPAALAAALAGCDGFPVIEVCPGDERHGEEFFVSDPQALILAVVPPDAEDPQEELLYWTLVATASKAVRQTLMSARIRGDDSQATRRLLQAFVNARVLGAHRDWFTESVLFPEYDDRIVRLPWTGWPSPLASARRPGQEPLAGRLGRLRHALGPAAERVVRALEDVGGPLARQSTQTLVEGLPLEWQRVFVSFEEEEKVA
jgi:hypothetical protein